MERRWHLLNAARTAATTSCSFTYVTEMILVQNWFEELKRLCPTGKK
jgi:hypothetical protein